MAKMATGSYYIVCRHGLEQPQGGADFGQLSQGRGLECEK